MRSARRKDRIYSAPCSRFLLELYLAILMGIVPMNGPCITSAYRELDLLRTGGAGM